MPTDSNPPEPLPAAPRRHGWRVALFFGLWTLFAALAVWWLIGNGGRKSDFLIQFGGGTPTSALDHLRAWCETHVELTWAYPWLLFAPYVLWLGARLQLEKRGLPLRGALLLMAGAGFVVASQAVTSRLHPRGAKSIVITASTMRNATHLGSTNYSRMIVFSTTSRVRTNEVPHLANLAPEPATDVLAQQIAQNVAPMIEQMRTTVPPLAALPAPSWSIALDALAYLCLVGVAQVVQVRRHLRAREQQAVLLEGRLNQARLRTLQAQLQPHFLFNALNGIAALIRSQPRVAEEMVTSLSELLRLALSQSNRQQIPLRQELEFLDRYLEIQQMRFGDRLRVERDIAPETLGCLVPSLLLQPLVENAVRHGLEPAPYPGLLRLVARVSGQSLLITITDNGVGLGGGNIVGQASRLSLTSKEHVPGEEISVERNADQATTERTEDGDRRDACPTNTVRGTGLGLASVRERLAALYGREQEFQLLPRSEGGVEVRLRLPMQAGETTAPAEAP